jgi:hypothetical protein
MKSFNGKGELQGVEAASVWAALLLEENCQFCMGAVK